MNSLVKLIRKIKGTVAALFLILASPVYADPFQPPQNIFRHFDISGRLTPESETEKRNKARRLALSSGAILLKQTRVWKRVEFAELKLKQRFSFEFKKSFPQAPVQGNASKKELGRGRQTSRGLSFSGGLQDNMKPALKFESRFRPADISVRFNVWDQSLDCEISSPPVNRLTGGKTSIDLNSEGGKTQALLKIKFEF